MVATIRAPQHLDEDKIKKKRPSLESVETLLQEIEVDGGALVKKMCAEKFYILFYQMTELIPLFAYLERLDALKFIMSQQDHFDMKGGRKDSIMKFTKSSS